MSIYYNHTTVQYTWLILSRVSFNPLKKKKKKYIYIYIYIYIYELINWIGTFSALHCTIKASRFIFKWKIMS